jgi:hypothetical protein
MHNNYARVTVDLIYPPCGLLVIADIWSEDPHVEDELKFTFRHTG